MKQIDHVVIENFQSHARSELRLSAGLNVIIGPSDHGKSAVLRAIRWALYNEPRGAEFVRVGARECRVTVTMNDGTAIIREMLLSKAGTPSRNRYIITEPGAEPQVFEGFGADVPVEVVRAHGMPQVQLDADKRVLLSFGSQLEGPFLMTETGSFRARAIGRLLGVHVVDAAIRNTQRDMRSVRTEVSRLEREMERYERELQPYEDIPEREAELNQVEQMLAQAVALSRRLQRLEEICRAMEQVEQESIGTQARLARLRSVNQADQALSQAGEVQRHLARLERLRTESERVREESAHCRERIGALTVLPAVEERARQSLQRQERLAALLRLRGELRQRESDLIETKRRADRMGQVGQAEELVRAMGTSLQRLERLRQHQTPLHDIDQRFQKGRELTEQSRADLGRHLREYETLLRQVGRCPTCMQPVAPERVKQILAELVGGRGGV